MIKNLLSWVFLLVALAGCKDTDEPNPAMMGYQYYPLEVGDYKIYQVTKIKIQFDVYDTTRYQMREVVKSSFVDQTNTVSYRIERSIRPFSYSQWVADSVITVTKSLTNVIATTDNTKRVKLIFPVKEGESWLGDIFNDRTVDDIKEPYTYSTVHQPFVLNDKKLLQINPAISFDSTVTVIQGEPVFDDGETTVTTLDDRKEVYAAGLGLIYRKFFRAGLCGAGESGCDSYVKDGNERHEVLIGYGKL